MNAEIEKLMALIGVEVEKIIAAGVEAQLVPVRAALGIVAPVPGRLRQPPRGPGKGSPIGKDFVAKFLVEWRAAKGKNGARKRERLLRKYKIGKTTAYGWLRAGEAPTGTSSGGRGKKRRFVDLATKLKYVEEAKQDGAGYVAQKYGVHADSIRNWMKGQALGAPGTRREATATAT